MRYLLITYVRKPNGQIDEQVGFSKRLRNSDLQTCNVILDYQDLKVLKCVIEGKRLERDFGPMHEYYKKAYPNLMEQIEQAYGMVRIEEPVDQPQTEEKKDGQ